MISLILLVLALVLFLVSGLPQVGPYWNRLISFGLAALVGSMLLAGR